MCLSLFYNRCGEALKKNRQLIGNSEQQIEYHKELERNYFKFTDQLAPLMAQANVNQARSILREAYFNVCSKTTNNNITLPSSSVGNNFSHELNNLSIANINSSRFSNGAGRYKSFSGVQSTK